MILSVLFLVFWGITLKGICKVKGPFLVNHHHQNIFKIKIFWPKVYQCIYFDWHSSRLLTCKKVIFILHKISKTHLIPRPVFRCCTTMASLETNCSNILRQFLKKTESDRLIWTYREGLIPCEVPGVMRTKQSFFTGYSWTTIKSFLLNLWVASTVLAFRKQVKVVLIFNCRA